MTDSAHPVYTFQVNLQGSSLFPSRYQQSQNRAYDEFNAMSDTRSIGIPGVGFFKHGEKFTVCGLLAQKIFREFITNGGGQLVVCNDPDVNCVPDTNVGTPAPASVTATGTSIMFPVFSVTQVTTGEGYLVNAVLTLVGGTFTEVASIVVTSVKTIAGQTVSEFAAAEGFGTFTGGTGYLASQTITMNDGTVVTVSEAGGGVITGFTISSITTPGIIGSNNTTLTQSFTSGEPGGTGFTLTLGQRNQQINSGSYVTTAEIANGEYTVMPTDPVSVTGGGFPDVAATFDITWGVKAVTVTDGGSGYTSVPDVSSPDAGGGEEASLTAVLTDDVVTSVIVVTPGGGYVLAAIPTFDAP